MRIAEKTLELNICSQINRISRSKLTWFGLTQAQEAALGFDACTKIKGRLLIFQFKASNHVLRDGSRRFSADHEQMRNLHKICKNYQRSVFYVLPLVGNTFELAKASDVLKATWLLDVNNIPNGLTPPLTKTGRPRQTHYIDLVPPRAVIRSDPFDVDLLSCSDFVEDNFSSSDGIQEIFENNLQFVNFVRDLPRNSVGLILK